MGSPNAPLDLTFSLTLQGHSDLSGSRSVWYTYIFLRLITTLNLDVTKESLLAAGVFRCRSGLSWLQLYSVFFWLICALPLLAIAALHKNASKNNPVHNLPAPDIWSLASVWSLSATWAQFDCPLAEYRLELYGSSSPCYFCRAFTSILFLHGQ